MLYDILPPLFLLASFGGIAVILSRVVMRVQQQRLNQEIRATAATHQTVASDDLFRSRGSKISVVKNRLALIPQAATSMKENIKNVRVKRQERKAEKASLLAVEEKMAAEARAVAPPKQGRFSRLKGSMQSVAENSRKGIQAVRARRQEKAEDEIESQEEFTNEVVEEESKPLVRRVTMAEDTNTDSEVAEGATSRLSLRRKKPKDQDPLSRAATCLRESQYDKAEDILLPYIIRHARDTSAYMLLGRAAVGRGEWAEALEIFQQVRAIDEDTPGLLSSLGKAAAKAGRVTLAVETLQKARDIEPENIAIREELLMIAKHTDNKVLERSVAEELVELRQEKASAEAN